MNSIKKQIRACDYLVWTAFIFMIVLRFTTVSYISSIAEETGATISQVATLYEMDYIVKLLINLKQFGGMLIFFIIPAIAMALYYYYRHKTLKGLFDIQILRFFVIFAFFVFLLNMVNDLAAFLGRII